MANGVMGFPAAPPVKKPSIYDRITQGLLGSSSYGGMLSEEDQKAAQRQGLLAIGSQLMSAGGPSPVRTSFGQAIGPALQAGQQAQRGYGQDMLEAMLLKTKLQAAGAGKRKKSVAVIGPNGTPILVDEQEAIDQGMQPYSAVQRAEAPASIQEYQLAKGQGYKGTFEQWVSDRAKASAIPSFGSMLVGNVPNVMNNRTGAVAPVSTLPDEAAGAAAVKEAEASAGTLATEQAKRDATFQEDMNVLDDEILRTQRLLTEFESGKYQTGPIAGRMPNLRTSAQDLSREQGKDTLKAISSATFGALSEGERAFLRELGVSENATEESNVNMLGQRLTQLTKTRNRLQSRRRLGLDASPAAASAVPVAVGQSTTINGVKITRKK